MRLTQWTDYTLRVLMYCAACQQRATPVTISEISSAYNISRSHLTKVVFALSGQGWLTTTRGRGGGLRLSRPAAEFDLEEIIKATETDFTMVECFEIKANQCGLATHCLLRGVLSEALQSYLAVLRRYTLADLVKDHTSGAGARTSAQRTKLVEHIMLTPGIPINLPTSPKGRVSRQLTP